MKRMKSIFAKTLTMLIISAASLNVVFSQLYECEDRDGQGYIMKPAYFKELARWRTKIIMGNNRNG